MPNLAELIQDYPLEGCLMLIGAFIGMSADSNFFNRIIFGVIYGAIGFGIGALIQFFYNER